jgi:hypothetical protein
MGYTGTCRVCGNRGALQIMGEDGTGLCKSCFYDGGNELTMAEAERAFADAPAIPCDPGEIQRIVDRITSCDDEVPSAPTIGDLAMLVARLCRHVEDTPAGRDIKEKALDYLRRKDISGSVLREIQSSMGLEPLISAEIVIDCPHCGKTLRPSRPGLWTCNFCHKPFTA